MRSFLLFLSVLFGALTGSADDSRPADAGSADRYTFAIDMGKADLTGIMAVSSRSDVIIGSLINEFGISAANFIYYKESGKLKLLDVIKFLDKWYIKRVLTADLKIALGLLYGVPVKISGNYTVDPLSDGVRVENIKRHITYEYRRIQTCPEEMETPGPGDIE